MVRALYKTPFNGAQALASAGPLLALRVLLAAAAGARRQGQEREALREALRQQLRGAECAVRVVSCGVLRSTRLLNGARII